jgi:type II secretory pathway component PulF
MLKNLLHSLNLSGFRATRDEFYEQLALSQENREGLRFFLDEEIKIAAGRQTADSSRAYALRLMRKRLARGDSTRFAPILGPVMPAADALLLSALDDAKDKAQLMRVIAQTIREQREMKQLVRSKLIPPLLILPGAFAFAYIMATRSLPVILKVAPAEVWTPFNMAVRKFSEFLTDYSAPMLVMGFVGLCWFLFQLPRWTGNSRIRLESMNPKTATLLFPVFPIALPLILYRDVQSSKVFNALSVMLQSGRTLNEALQAIKRVSNPWMRWHMVRILRYLEANPTAYSKAFESGLMSPHMLARLSSRIRNTPKFDEVLIDLGQKGSSEVRAVVAKQMSVLNALLLALGGALVVFVWLGQLSISQSMQNELSPTKQMGKRLGR